MSPLQTPPPYPRPRPQTLLTWSGQAPPSVRFNFLKLMPERALILLFTLKKILQDLIQQLFEAKAQTCIPASGSWIGQQGPEPIKRNPLAVNSTLLPFLKFNFKVFWLTESPSGIITSSISFRRIDYMDDKQLIKNQVGFKILTRIH